MTAPAGAPHTSFWRHLRLKLHLASPRERDQALHAAWLGGGPTAAASGAARAAMACAFVGIGVAGAWAYLPAAALCLNGFTAFVGLDPGRAKPDLPGAPLERILLGPDGTYRAMTIAEAQGDPTARRRPGPQWLFSPEANAALQRRHDLWQEEYGDEVYRGILKLRAVRLALWHYIADLMRGKSFARAPGGWARRMSPEELDGYAQQVEAEFRSGGGGTR